MTVRDAVDEPLAKVTEFGRSVSPRVVVHRSRLCHSEIVGPGCTASKLASATHESERGVYGW